MKKGDYDVRCALILLTSHDYSLRKTVKWFTLHTRIAFLFQFWLLYLYCKLLCRIIYISIPWPCTYKSGVKKHECISVDTYNVLILIWRTWMTLTPTAIKTLSKSFHNDLSRLWYLKTDPVYLFKSYKHIGIILKSKLVWLIYMPVNGEYGATSISSERYENTSIQTSVNVFTTKSLFLYTIWMWTLVWLATQS